MFMKTTVLKGNPMPAGEIERIEQRLKDVGKTKTDLAIALGAPAETASSYYNNWRTRGLPKNRQTLAAQFLGVTIEWIVKGIKDVKINRESYESQLQAQRAAAALAAQGYILSCATSNDRNFLLLAVKDESHEASVVVINAEGWVKADTIRAMIEEDVLVRRLKVSTEVMQRLVAADFSSVEFFGDEKNKGWWGTVEFVNHDSIYAPKVQDRHGEYHALPRPMASIMDFYTSKQLDIDDLIFLEQMAARLASKKLPG